MDLRVQKTLRNIRETFIALAKEKSIDSITVKELCERALINKATFYSHYENLNELIVLLEDEYVKEITGEIDFADLFFTNPEQFFLKLWQTYRANSNSSFLMKGSRGWDLMYLMIESLRRSIQKANPEIKKVAGADMAITFCVYGSSGVAPIHQNETVEKRAKQTGRAIAAVLNEFGLLKKPAQE